MEDDRAQPIVGTGEPPEEILNTPANTPPTRQEARLVLSGMLDESSNDSSVPIHSSTPLSSPLHAQAEKELTEESLPSYAPPAPPVIPQQPKPSVPAPTIKEIHHVTPAPRPTPPLSSVQKIIPSQKPPLRTIPIAPTLQRNKATSLADIALSQESIRTTHTDMPEKKSSGMRRVLFVGGAIFVFLIGGSVALYSALSNKNPKPIISVEKPLKNFLISPDITYALSFTNDKTQDKKLFEDALTKENKTDGAIGAFFVTGKNSAGKEGELSATEVLTTLDAKIPELFIQSLGTDYMTGRFAGASGNSLFFVLTVTSYEDIFGGLQNWLTSDALSFAQTLKTTDVVSTDGLTWKNVFIKNIDARILTNDDDEILLAYTFLTRNRLLIAADKESFIALTERYATPQKPAP